MGLVPCQGLALNCHRQGRERAGTVAVTVTVPVPVPLPCCQPSPEGRMGTEGFGGAFPCGGDTAGWQGVAGGGTGAAQCPVPPADVQMLPEPPLAAACVWKVMNFCTN